MEEGEKDLVVMSNSSDKNSCVSHKSPNSTNSKALDGHSFLSLVAANDVSKVATFLKQNNAEKKDFLHVIHNEQGENALHVAASHGHLDMVKMLAQQGHFPLDALTRQTDQTKSDKNNALHLAAFNGHSEVVGWLESQGVGIYYEDTEEFEIDWQEKPQTNNRGNEGYQTDAFFQQWLMENVQNIFFNFIKIGDLTGLQNLIEHFQATCTTAKFFHINLLNEHLSTGAHIAAQNGHLDVLKWLVSQGIDLMKTNNMKETCLHMAVCEGHLDVVRYLLTECRMDISPLTSQKWNVLHIACFYGHLLIVQFLLGSDGFSHVLFQCAVLSVEANRLEILKILLKEDESIVDRQNEFGETLLHVAASISGGNNIIEVLLDNGAHISVVDSNGKLPIHTAISHRILESVQVLAEFKYVDLKNKELLLFSIKHGSVSIVRYLISKFQIDLNDENLLDVLNCESKFSALSRKNLLMEIATDQQIAAETKSNKFMDILLLEEENRDLQSPRKCEKSKLKNSLNKGIISGNASVVDNSVNAVGKKKIVELPPPSSSTNGCTNKELLCRIGPLTYNSQIININSLHQDKFHYFEGYHDDFGMVSIKRILKNPKTIMLSHYERRFYQKLVSIYGSNVCPSILQYFSFEEDDKAVYIVVENCQMSLFDFCSPRPTTEDYSKILNLSYKRCFECPQLIKELISSVKFLHDHGICHGLLQPSSIFLNNKMSLKLGDFDYAREFWNNSFDSVSITDNRGLNVWSPPELINNGFSGIHDTQQFRTSGDIFCLGMCIYFVLSGGDHAFHFDIDQMHRGCFDINVLVGCDEVLDLLEKMLKRNPISRISINEVYNHPFLWSFTKKLDYIECISNQLEARREKLESIKIGYDWRSRMPKLVMQSLYQWRNYSKSTVDLIRCIRNLKQHCYSQSDEVLECILSCVDGQDSSSSSISRVRLSTILQKDMLAKFFFKKFPSLIHNIWTKLGEIV